MVNPRTLSWAALLASFVSCSEEAQGPGGSAGDAGSSADAGAGGSAQGGASGAGGASSGGTSGAVGADASSGGADASGTGGAAGASLAELKLPIRAAFFYPWFPETWGPLSDPFTNYEPLAGYYDSSAPAVIQTQLDELRYAHVAAAIASWWGKGTKTDGRITKLLDASLADGAAHGGDTLRWSLYVEAEGDAKPWGSDDPTATQIQSDLEHIYAAYGQHPAFLRLDGKPVIFTWGDSSDDCSAPARWVAANDAFEKVSGRRFFIVMKLFTGFKTCAPQPDSWHQYGPAVGYHEHLPFSAVVSPGFWLKGDASPTLARDPARFKADVAKMNAAPVSFKLVTTFNEWGEGTAVEPAKQWQSSSGRGVYLDILHDLPP